MTTLFFKGYLLSIFHHPHPYPPGEKDGWGSTAVKKAGTEFHLRTIYHSYQEKIVVTLLANERVGK